MSSSTPYFYIYKDAANEWRWYFQATNGKKIADSGEGYHNLADCEHGISLIKKDTPTAVTIGDSSYDKAKKG